MKKLIAIISTISIIALPFVAAAAGTDHIGPIAGATTDGGSCGNTWANDTYNLSFNIHDNGDGTFAVKTEYKDGTFVTFDGMSPGACETANNHGTTVTAGVQGSFQGWVAETITSATYDPTACSVAGVCTSRSSAIAAMFPGGTETSFSGFNFEYNSPDKTLSNHHWQDKSDNAGNDKFVGDIAN